MSTEATPGLYNAPMNVATKLNRELIARYISENRIDALISLFEVQFDALRRAEALQMLHIHEIRTLKHQLAGSPQESSQGRTQVQRDTSSRARPVQPTTPKPAKRNLEEEIEL